MFQLQLYQQETIKHYQNFLVKDLKDQFIGMNINQKVRIKLWQMNIGISSNQNLLELIACLFQFIQIKIPMLKDLMLKNNIYQKAQSKIITPSLLEKTFMTKQLIQI